MIKMRIQCSKCHKHKDQSQFYPNKARKSGLDHYCKECRKRKVVENYCPIRTRNRKNRYLKGWLNFFITEYGSDPYCQVCNQPLEWRGKKSTTVHWDHGHGFNKISPSDFTYSRPCNERNIKVWRELDFGILCHSCNKSLPTLDREQWVRNVMKYVFGQECRILRLKIEQAKPLLDWDY